MTNNNTFYFLNNLKAEYQSKAFCAESELIEDMDAEEREANEHDIKAFNAIVNGICLLIAQEYPVEIVDDEGIYKPLARAGLISTLFKQDKEIKYLKDEVTHYIKTREDSTKNIESTCESKIKDIQASLNFHKAQSEERRACIEGLNVTTERLNATIDSLNARIADLETEIGLNAAIADGSLYTDTVKGDLKSKGEAVAREILKDYHPDIDFNDPDFVQKVTQAHKPKT